MGRLPGLAVLATLIAGCSSDGTPNDCDADCEAADLANLAPDLGQASDLSAPPDLAPIVYPVYAHTDKVLFTIDSAGATMVGAFDCIGGAGQDTAMTDIAVDRSQTLWGISGKNIYQLSIQGSTVHCATTTALQNPMSFYGLSFAPVGVLDASQEVLVAVNTAGELWSVDAQGKLAMHGTFGVVPADDGHGRAYANAGKAWELSGDLVLLANGGNPIGWATVHDCPNPPSTAGCNTVDTLVALDLTKLAPIGNQNVVGSVRGQIVKAAGCSDAAASYGGLFGLAVSGGSVIGLSRAASVVRISETDGTGCLLLSTPGDLWGGGGTTTLVAP